MDFIFKTTILNLYLQKNDIQVNLTKLNLI
jgi:hypothetical protein